MQQEEDVLTYAMFPQVAPKFFEKRNQKLMGVDGEHADYTNKSHPVYRHMRPGRICSAPALGAELFCTPPPKGGAEPCA